MKSKKLIIGIMVMVIAAFAVIVALPGCESTSSLLIVENNEDGSVAVTAQDAEPESEGVGYITLAKGQKLNVRSNLTDSSTVKVEVYPRETDDTTDVLLEETFTAVDARSFEMPKGDYAIRITVEKSANGTMDIKAE